MCVHPYYYHHIIVLLFSIRWLRIMEAVLFMAVFVDSTKCCGNRVWCHRAMVFDSSTAVSTKKKDILALLMSVFSMSSMQRMVPSKSPFKHNLLRMWTKMLPPPFAICAIILTSIWMDMIAAILFCRTSSRSMLICIRPSMRT